MECSPVCLLLVLSVWLGTAAGKSLAEWDPTIPGAANITLLDIEPSRKHPSVCETAKCFPKCCPFGQRIVNKTCSPTDLRFEPQIAAGDDKYYSIFDEPTEPFYIIVGELCSGAEERVAIEPGDFILFYNGTAAVGTTAQNGSFVMFGEDLWYQPNQYCLDIFQNETTEKVYAVPVLCITQTKMGSVPLHLIFYPIGILLSVCFLLVTMFVYLMVPDLRDLQGMSLVCHLICQGLAYLFLVTVQFSSEDFDEISCGVLAYAIQLLFSGSFFWLNVLCFDATWGVIVATLPEKDPEGGPRWWWRLHYPGAKKWVKVGQVYMAGCEDRDEKTDIERKKQERRLKIRVFFYYSLYAWFFSFLPVILVLANRYGPAIPNTYLEYNLVSYNCGFDVLSDMNSLPYFYIPVGTTLAINLLMFILTLVRSVNFPWNPTGPHRIPRQKARMSFMLFFLMAMNWLTDIISWAYKGEAFTWSVLNVFNILQGVVTFGIYILEDRVKLLIVTKLLPRLRNLKAKYFCKEQPEEPDQITENSYMLRFNNLNESRN